LVFVFVAALLAVTWFDRRATAKIVDNHVAMAQINVHDNEIMPPPPYRKRSV
jgi:hypothetical protein